jgi:hypothetical protein
MDGDFGVDLGNLPHVGALIPHVITEFVVPAQSFAVSIALIALAILIVLLVTLVDGSEKR